MLQKQCRFMKSNLLYQKLHNVTNNIVILKHLTARVLRVRCKRLKTDILNTIFSYVRTSKIGPWACCS